MASLFGGSGGSGNIGGNNGSGAMEVGFHIKNPSSVKEYAYTEDKNRQFRPDMEDTCCHQDKLNNDPTCGLFGVFDGHGGK